MRSASLAIISLLLGGLIGCGGAEFTSEGTSNGSGGAATTSASTGASTGTSTGTSTVSSTGTSMSDEDCTNGVDDNGDGLIDCADPQCTSGGFSCLEIPQGWEAAEFTSNAAPAMLPNCDPGFPTAMKGDMGTLSANPATCDKCGCEDPDPAMESCGLPTFTFDATKCDMGFASITPMHAGDCESIPPLQLPAYSITAGLVPVIGGSCDPKGGGATVPPKVWSGERRNLPGDSARQRMRGGPRVRPQGELELLRQGMHCATRRSRLPWRLRHEDSRLSDDEGHTRLQQMRLQRRQGRDVQSGDGQLLLWRYLPTNLFPCPNRDVRHPRRDGPRADSPSIHPRTRRPEWR